MECPEDADRIKYKYNCGATRLHNGKTYTCTRDRGHEDDHHAHDKQGNCLLIWKVQEDKYFFNEGDVIDTLLLEAVIEYVSEHFIYDDNCKEMIKKKNKWNRGKMRPAKVKCVKTLELIVKG